MWTKLSTQLYGMMGESAGAGAALDGGVSVKRNRFVSMDYPEVSGATHDLRDGVCGNDGLTDKVKIKAVTDARMWAHLKTAAGMVNLFDHTDILEPFYVMVASYCFNQFVMQQQAPLLR